VRPGEVVGLTALPIDSRPSSCGSCAPPSLPVSRFAALAGIPERTHRRRLAMLRSGNDTIKGPWPTPVVDGVEAVAAKYAGAWPAWGHRKIAALMRVDGHVVSTSTVERALRRRGLLLPVGYRADRKSWAVLRRRCVFRDPPTQRNRVWLMDFVRHEALWIRTEVRVLRRWAVAAVW